MLGYQSGPVMLSAARARRGFTLIEMVITVSVFGILAAMMAPSFANWIQDAQVRTVAEALQNSLRVAQAEAARRHRQVALVLTNNTPLAGAAAQANGKNWVVNVIANTLAGDGSDSSAGMMVQSGSLGVVAPAAQITGPAAICFNSLGRLTAVNDGTYNCGIPPSSIVSYDVTSSRSSTTRALRVTVSLGGLIRMCDPNKTLSQANPDGCT
ncbi:MAG: GspH/FimT family pseudopilin [Pseudomonadota bacterium]